MATSAANPVIDKGDQTLRKDSDGSLYVVSSEGELLIKESWGDQAITWLEYDSGGSSSYRELREAVAVEAITKEGAVTGYLLAVKRTYNPDVSQNPDDQVSWTIYRVTVEGRIENGRMDASGAWFNPTEETKSIQPFETLFAQDLNGDGDIGVVTVTAQADDDGDVVIARDSDGGLYIKDSDPSSPELLTLKDAGYWEQSYTWSNGSQKSEVIAAESLKGDDGSVTGYLVAIKRTDVNGTEEAVTYDVYHLGPDGKQSNGYAMPGYGGSDSLSAWGLKSLVAYEEKFNQDFNGDKKYGITKNDLTLVFGDSVEAGDAYLARDSLQGLYIVDGDTVVIPANAGSWEYNNTWGESDYNKREALGAVRALDEGGNVIGYHVAFKSEYKTGNDVRVTYDIYRLDSTGKQVYGGGDANYTSVDENKYGLKSSEIAIHEELFKQDLNGDLQVGLNAASFTDLYLDSDQAGVRLARDKEGSLYAVDTGSATVTPLNDSNGWEYDNSWGTDSYSKREAIAIEAFKDGDKDGYKLILKQTNKQPNSEETVSYDVYALDAQGRQTWGQMDADGIWRDPNAYGLKSLVSYEDEFGQDFNNDGVKGINKALLKFIAGADDGVRVARDIEGAIYIVDGDNYISPPNSSWWEYQQDWGGGSNSRSVLAATARLNDSGEKIGYKVAFKSTYQQGDGAPTVTYDIYALDLTGSQDMMSMYASGGTAGGNVDESVYGAKTLAPYEKEFKQDFNGDGVIGINVDALRVLGSDAVGAKLARDSEGALYIIPEASSQPIAVAAGWFEYTNSWGTSDYNKREAIAVTTVKSGETTTGYVVALRNANKWGNQDEQVTYDLVQLDTNGKQVWDYMGAGDGSTSYNVWGAKSLTAYEVLFAQDFNEDGYIGIDPATLVRVSTDTTGTSLARDKDGGLYLIGTDNQAKTISNAEWLEYDNSWGDGYSKRTAVAVEAAIDGSGAITGYTLVTRSVNKWGNQKEEASWDILQLNSAGRLTYGEMVDGVWQDKSVWGTKSIAAYEPQLKQDLNGDGIIGVDTSKLTQVNTDTFGVQLMKDADGGMYAVGDSAGLKTAIPLASSYVEYSYSWGTGSNKRAAVAVEAVDVSGVTQYKLALKNTNTWDSQTTVTWDIMTFDAQGKQLYGSMAGGTWSDPNIYGSKSIAVYETLFKQDLNGDGSVGIDLSKLTEVATDTVGVRLRRDAAQALFLVDTVNGVETAIAVGDGQWLEYNNAWSGGGNSREAVAVEKDGSGYKLVLKQTNSWNGNSTVSWEVLTLDAQGRVSWSTAAGMSVSSDPRKAEDAVKQDLDGDGVVGVSLSDIKLLSTDVTGVRLGWSETNGNRTLYILEGVETAASGELTAATTKIAVVDSTGMTPQIAQSYKWLSGSAKSTVYAVEKQTNADGTYQYVIAVKNERTTVSDTKVTWSFYEVADSGLLDWGTAVTTSSPGAYETLFNIDFNGDGAVGRVTSTASLTAVATDTSGVKPYLDAGKALYFDDSGTLIYAVDANGGALTFDYSASGESAAVYAVRKMQDASFRVFVKHVETEGGTEAWEVHSFAKADAASNAVIDWTKSRYVKSITDVEELMGQDVDGNSAVGAGVTKFAAVEADAPSVVAQTDELGRLNIFDAEKNDPIQVRDALGLRVVFETDETESISGVSYGLTKTVLGAESEVVDSVLQYRVIVKTTQTEDGVTVSEAFQIFTVSESGILLKDSVETPSPMGWETFFGQDLDGDGLSVGVVQQNLTIFSDTDLASDQFEAVYVRSNEAYLPVLDGQGGANITFASSLVLPDYSSTSSPFTAELQPDGSMRLGVKSEIVLGSEAITGYEIHTFNTNEDASAWLWQEVSFVDDPTELVPLFGQEVIALIA